MKENICRHKYSRLFTHNVKSARQSSYTVNSDGHFDDQKGFLTVCKNNAGDPYGACRTIGTVEGQNLRLLLPFAPTCNKS